MSFLSAWWLAALIPWGVLAIWLLTGRHERTAVPFLDLWRAGQAPPPKAVRAIHAPPVPVVLILLSALVAIVAAARPSLNVIHSTPSQKLVFVIDRGFSASASPDWPGQIVRTSATISDRFPQAPIERVQIPDSMPTLIDTRHLLPPVIQQSLLDPSAIIVAFTDQTIDIDHPRFIQVAPESRGSNIGIVAAAAATSPRAQVMVRIRSDSPQTNGELKVANVQRSIQLPASGEQKNYFIDLDRLDSVIPIHLHPADDLAADNIIELVRTSVRPRLIPETDLPAEILRVTDSYSRLRPAADGSSPIHITSRQDFAPGIHAIQIARTTRQSSGAVRVESHPIASNVNWQDIAQSPIRIADAPGAGWRAIGWTGEAPIVAIREDPVRQVWIGFESDSFPRSADFVVFWTNVFDWIAGQGERFETRGILAQPILTPPQTDWEAKLRTLPPTLRPGREIAGILALAALVAIFMAALFPGVAKIAR